MAKESRGEGLAKAILEQLSGERGKRVLVARAKQAREVLPQALLQGGCEVDVVPVYETHPRPQAGERLRELLDKRDVDAITFTSASTVYAFCDALGEDAPAIVKKSAAIVASIGPITTEAAIARGLEVTTTAQTYTLEGLVTALELEFSKRK